MTTEVEMLKRVRCPWGDYGRILVHGMSRHRAPVDGRIQLERTGPYVPALTQPVPIHHLVTDAFRQRIEAAGLQGAAFQRVDLVHVAHVEWEKWDRTKPEPGFYPKSNEPEDYVLARPHDPALAARVGPIWQMEPVRWGENVPGTTPTIRAGREPMPDIFVADKALGLFISSKARSVFFAATIEWFEFHPVAVVQS